MDMLALDPARMSKHDFDPKSDPRWAALAEYLRAAAAAGEIVRLTARPDILTPAEAAARLGVSRSTITRRINAGEIKAIKVGWHHRIPIREFGRFHDAVVGAMISDVSADLEADLHCSAANTPVWSRRTPKPGTSWATVASRPAP